ncbi:hypothetical protein Bbelb_375910 [Branchiostoma belcheri]|nr:hypothetical protein Bbelb_375910 [Branchiostoma belcheri]
MFENKSRTGGIYFRANRKPPRDRRNGRKRNDVSIRKPVGGYDRVSGAEMRLPLRCAALPADKVLMKVVSLRRMDDCTGGEMSYHRFTSLQRTYRTGEGKSFYRFTSPKAVGSYIIGSRHYSAGLNHWLTSVQGTYRTGIGKSHHRFYITTALVNNIIGAHLSHWRREIILPFHITKGSGKLYHRFTDTSPQALMGVDEGGFEISLRRLDDWSAPIARAEGRYMYITGSRHSARAAISYITCSRHYSTPIARAEGRYINVSRHYSVGQYNWLTSVHRTCRLQT